MLSLVLVLVLVAVVLVPLLVQSLVVVSVGVLPSVLVLALPPVLVLVLVQVLEWLWLPHWYHQPLVDGPSPVARRWLRPQRSRWRHRPALPVAAVRFAVVRCHGPRPVCLLSPLPQCRCGAAVSWRCVCRRWRRRCKRTRVTVSDSTRTVMAAVMRYCPAVACLVVVTVVGVVVAVVVVVALAVGLSRRRTVEGVCGGAVTVMAVVVRLVAAAVLAVAVPMAVGGAAVAWSCQRGLGAEMVSGLASGCGCESCRSAVYVGM